MTRQTWVCCGLLLLAGLSREGFSQVDAKPTLSIRPKHAWTNVFAGRKTTIDCLVSSEVGGEALLTWAVSLDRAVMARGQWRSLLVANVAQEVSFELDLPELRPGVVLPVTVTMSLRRGQANHTETLSLTAFSPDVAANREEWLKSLDLVLFDPSKSTRAVFEKAHIPCRTIEHAHDASKTSLLIQGAGIEPARIANSWHAAIDAAKSGRRVLVLGSHGATIKWSELMDPKSGHSTSFRQCNVIQQLDKRLDAAEWPAPGKLVAISMRGIVKGESAVFELRDDSEGWPWLDIQYPHGGRLIWTGVGLIESWESTPAARYLLIKLLEELSSKPSNTEDSKHVER